MSCMFRVPLVYSCSNMQRCCPSCDLQSRARLASAVATASKRSIQTSRLLGSLHWGSDVPAHLRLSIAAVDSESYIGSTHFSSCFPCDARRSARASTLSMLTHLDTCTLGYSRHSKLQSSVAPRHQSTLAASVSHAHTNLKFCGDRREIKNLAISIMLSACLRSAPLQDLFTTMNRRLPHHQHLDSLNRRLK